MLVKEELCYSKQTIFKNCKAMSPSLKIYVEALYDTTPENVVKKSYSVSGFFDVKNKIDFTKLNSDSDMRNKTGVYLMLDKGVPVYIGIGGRKVNKDGKGEGRLLTRIKQEMRDFKFGGGSDSGATLSKNIQTIETLLGNKTDDILAKKIIRNLDLIVFVVGSDNLSQNIKRSINLEIVLISLFHPKYNF